MSDRVSDMVAENLCIILEGKRKGLEKSESSKLLYESAGGGFKMYTLHAEGVSVSGFDANKKEGFYQEKGLAPKEFVARYVQTQDVADKILINLKVIPV